LRIIKKKKIADPEVVVSLPAIVTGSFFYTGFFPIASGTVGSLAALLIFFIEPALEPVVLFSLVIIFFAAGTLSARPIMKRYGDDPSVIVIDEVVGMWITILLFIAFGKTELSFFNAAACFVFFRLFDIIKIQPAKYFDESKSAFGVMMDDVIAGIYAGIVCVIISYTGFYPF